MTQSKILCVVLITLICTSLVFCETEAEETVEVETQQKEYLTGETMQFETEVSRLMELIVRSLYSKKDIFLREIISNGADALDRIRFMSLTDKNCLGETPEFEMRIKINKEDRTIELRDTGVGMTKEELIKNLGTIARSGTQAFLDQVEEKGDLSAIGQFGVGFYSVFLVADLVDVYSKSNDDDQYHWQSTSENTFTIAKDDSEPLGRGTRVVLHIREDSDEFLSEEKLIGLATHYSEFIQFPIYVLTEEEIEVPIEEAEVEVEENVELDEEEEEELLEDKKDTEPKTEKKMVQTWKHINEQPAIWVRNPKKVSDDDYVKFYQSLTGTDDEPISHIHFKVEGDYDFRSILYIPRHHTTNLVDQFDKTRLKLYVKRVLISDENTELLPRWLNFLRGVVDSDDLPLNVSRETLQKSRALKTIMRKLVQKALDMFKKLQKNNLEEYYEFYDTFGKFLKIGMIEDSKSREKLSRLLIFETSYTIEEESETEHPVISTLTDYVKRMPEDQDDIYYAVAESVEKARKLPFVESLVARGFEVIFFTDPLDEPALQNMGTFEDKKIVPASSSKASLENEIESEDLEKLAAFIKKYTPKEVTKVKYSDSMLSAPSMLIHGERAASANMERLIQQQRQLDPTFSADWKPERELVINANHPIVSALAKKVIRLPEKVDSEEEKLLLGECEDAAHLLYDTALLTSGYDVEDHHVLAKRIYRMMTMGLGVSDEEAPSFDEMKERFAERKAKKEAEAEAEAAAAVEEEGEDIEFEEVEINETEPELDEKYFTLDNEDVVPEEIARDEL
eukprot:TRINITY_DN2974_c1_g1_i1.p1 TRINITY_DN2974_c1_g1~~TRINITY_DN2974_c1_g1_i1.p1  ORF type:complete len:804 (+),score=324.77 TRINITY_DN2974_c1_g1_i1:33-2414(+)